MRRCLSPVGMFVSAGLDRTRVAEADRLRPDASWVDAPARSGMALAPGLTAR